MEKAKDQIIEILKSECLKQKLDFHVLNAIVKTESNYSNSAVRYERSFPWIVTPDKFAKLNGITEITERQLQHFSWGCLQLVGGTARDIGFTGPLVTLLDPAINIPWGCKFFKKRCDNYEYISDKIASYNAGSVRRRQDGTYLNQEYVDKVLAAYRLSIIDYGHAGNKA